MRSFHCAAFAAVLAFFALAGCKAPQAATREAIVARVNGEPVLLAELLVHFEQLKAEQDEISRKNPRLVEQLKARALNEAIILRLLRQEAAKKRVVVAREEVEARLLNWKDSYPPGAFEEMLRKQSLTEEFIRRRLEDQILLEKFVENTFDPETRISDEEAKAHYTAHQNEFQRQERVHAFQIVVPTREEAEKVRQEIVSGAISFESAARKYSLSPDSTNGGDLGFFARNEKIAAFNEAFGLALNVVSKPIQSRYGVHLLKVVEKQPARKLAFDEAKGEIAKRLKRRKQMKVYTEWVTKLLKDGEFYRNETVYARVQ
jgi:parvulin-like peptidyl-prolyl isomerase